MTYGKSSRARFVGWRGLVATAAAAGGDPEDVAPAKAAAPKIATSPAPAAAKGKAKL